MTTTSITFRTNANNKKSIDMLAKSMGGSRTMVINQAIEAYTDLYRWQLKEIEHGIADADTGRYAKKNWRDSFSELRKDIKNETSSN